MLRGVHEYEGHCQRVSHQHRPPPALDASPQEHRDHRGQCGVQRGNRRDQIHAGLSGVDQCAGRLQMQRSPAASRDPLNEQLRTGLASAHRAQQPAVRDVSGTSEHAARAGRATGDVGRCAARGCPRRCGRRNDVDDERGEGQRDEPPDKRCPVVSVAQPQHSGDRIGQDEKRHVDAADDDFPPRRLRHLDALLQPHGRDGAEEQPSIRLGLEMPKCWRSEQCGRPPAEVIHQQHNREWEPIAHDRKNFVPATDASGDEPGGDVEQQQFAVECEPVSQSPVGHDEGPAGDRRPPDQRQPTLVRCPSVNLFGGPDRLDRHGMEVPGAMRPSERCGLWFARQDLDFSTGRD